ncbi:MAG: mannose-1-phosphate guanylyltransferase/mannose-6-phosphate isomerase, partial [Bosea sp. (in: a-proteobacteria)]
NSGNFLFSADTMLAEYGRFAPESLAHVRGAVVEAATDLGAPILNEDRFSQADQKSIDYSVMEKTDRAAVVAGQFGWSDIGGWDALWEISAKDEAGNASNGNVILRDTSNSYAASDSQLVAVIGLENVVVVANRDAVLVADKSRSAEVKGLVDQLKKEGRPEATNHAKCYRPWGWYQTLELAGRFQVKRIVVYPGGRLSLQKHFHRSEHWVVVRGTASVTVGDDIRSLHENESVYIPIGAVHRLENPGKIDVEVIEVQTGSYLGEDDIVRLDDIYNRA